jgi:hypothetical protein
MKNNMLFSNKKTIDALVKEFDYKTTTAISLEKGALPFIKRGIPPPTPRYLSGDRMPLSNVTIMAVTPDRGILSNDTWRKNFSFCKGKYALFG